VIGIALPPEVVRERIAVRYARQMDDGFLAEVEALRARPGGMSRTACQALGYRELLDHLDGRCTLEEALDLAIRRTRKFARRQRAWFRKDPRVRWLDGPDPALAGLMIALESRSGVSDPLT
jgi:tRNA dimethylallyltransferase